MINGNKGAPVDDTFPEQSPPPGGGKTREAWQGGAPRKSRPTENGNSRILPLSPSAPPPSRRGAAQEDCFASNDAARPAVLYEDAAVLVTIKPAGLLSAPVEGKAEKSLPALLSPHAPLYVVHRLDRPTAGVMVYAKTAAAASFLQNEGDMEKTYLAVCEGVPKEKAARLSDLLFFDRAKDKSYIVSRARRGVKEARLSCELVKTVHSTSVGEGFSLRLGHARGLTPHCGVIQHPRFATRPLPPANGKADQAQCPLSLLRVTLDTGRTHQIRAQFSHRALPLYGDRRYGAKTDGTLGLFAARLSFIHPKTKKRMTFEAPLPTTAPFSLFAE